MRIRTVLVSAAVVAALAFPSVGHAATNQGIFGNVAWTSEIQLNTRTNVFGNFAFGYGRTRAEPRNGATVLSSSVTVELRKNRAVASNKTNTNIVPNPFDSNATTAATDTDNIARPGRFQVFTKHSFSAVGVTSSIPNMSTMEAAL